MIRIEELTRRLGAADFFADAGGPQQAKSVQTRRKLLAAAIECLAESGYARTTTPMIARRAGLSRGAMLHHYASRAELIDAAIDFICVTRLRNYVATVESLPPVERADEQREMEICWQDLLTIEYQAFLELQIAARTDAELRLLFEPKARRYDQVLEELLPELFPDWEGQREKQRLAIDFVQATLQGLVLNRRIVAPGARRMGVLHLLAAMSRGLLSGEITPRPVTPAEAAAEDAAASAAGDERGL